MWLALSFLSSALLGGYDSFKKASLRDNAVFPVLLVNTVLCSLIFLPLALQRPFGGWEVQRFILLKSVIVLSSWIAGYFAIKHLPLTIVGPVNATRPVLVLIGAMILFGERLNPWQWAGVILAVISFFLLGLGGRKEGIYFHRNRWVFCLVLAALIGAASGLYDRFLMAPAENGGAGLDRSLVLPWYNIYQVAIMAVLTALLWRPKTASGTPAGPVAAEQASPTAGQLPARAGQHAFHETAPFHWRWTIPFISLFLCGADYAYMQALSDPDALVSVVSMIRRGSVVVSFLFGAFVFHEKNLRAKAFDLALVLLGMVFLFIGSRA